MSERIPCINPKCRRTAPADKYEPGEEIICRACWQLLPAHISGRWKRFGRRERRLIRLIDRRLVHHEIDAGRINAMAARMDARRIEIWGAIRTFFLEPDRPAGLDAFLREAGLS